MNQSKNINQLCLRIDIPEIRHLSGLCQLLYGGILLPASLSEEGEHGLVILITGKPGTGKSTLSLQLAVSAVYCNWSSSIGDRNYRGVQYFSLEQDKKDIRAKLDKMMLRGAESKSEQAELAELARIQESVSNNLKIYPDTIPFSQSGNPEEPYSFDSYPLQWINRVEKKLDSEKENNKLVVIDGLNLIDTGERSLLDLYRLVGVLRRRSLVSVIVLEPFMDRAESVEYLVDLVINMEGRADESTLQYFLHQLSVTKSRYQATALGWHQYKIRDEGIEVFPSLHYELTRGPNYMRVQCELSKIPAIKLQTEGENGRGSIEGIDDTEKEIAEESIIVRMLGKIKEGSTTAILGARRTSKSYMTLDFLRAGARLEKCGLLLSIMDNQGTVERKLSCELKEEEQQVSRCNRRRAGQCQDCDSRVCLFHLRPGFVTANEFFNYLKKSIEERAQDKKIERLVLWDLTQIEFRFPFLKNDIMFLPTFMDYLKVQKITSVIMGSQSSNLANAASAMADNALYCWRDHVKYVMPEDEKDKDLPWLATVNSKKFLLIGPKKMEIPINTEVLMIYVDRQETEVETNPKIKKLYCFPFRESPLDDPQKDTADWRITEWEKVIYAFDKAQDQIAKIEEKMK